MQSIDRAVNEQKKKKIEKRTKKKNTRIQWKKHGQKKFTIEL